MLLPITDIQCHLDKKTNSTSNLKEQGECELFFHPCIYAKRAPISILKNYFMYNTFDLSSADVYRTFNYV